MKSRYVDIDMESLCALDHGCGGCKTKGKCCCASYEICLTEEEVDRATVWMGQAAQYATHLLTKDGYVNCFAECDDGLYSIDTTDDGVCVFAYANEDRLLCSLHSVALEHAVALRDIKPISCLLWPLSVSEGKHKSISVQDDALDFSCNRKRRKKRSIVHRSIVEILETVFGEHFTRQVKDAAANGEKKVRIPLPGRVHLK